MVTPLSMCLRLLGLAVTIFAAPADALQRDAAPVGPIAGGVLDPIYQPPPPPEMTPVPPYGTHVSQKTSRR